VVAKLVKRIQAQKAGGAGKQQPQPEPAGPDPVYDVWNAAPAKPRKVVYKGVKLPLVPPSLPGQSYNPTVEDHQEVIRKVSRMGHVVAGEACRLTGEIHTVSCRGTHIIYLPNPIIRSYRCLRYNPVIKGTTDGVYASCVRRWRWR
jgi:hypothetical protein